LIPAPEGDGWLITVANRRDVKLSCILILDTATLEDGPIAIVELPFRLRAGIHGSWVPASEFADRRDLCDMDGITPEMRDEFVETTVHTPFPSNSERINMTAAAGDHMNGAPA